MTSRLLLALSTLLCLSTWSPELRAQEVAPLVVQAELFKTNKSGTKFAAFKASKAFTVVVTLHDGADGPVLHSETLTVLPAAGAAPSSPGVVALPGKLGAVPVPLVLGETVPLSPAVVGRDLWMSTQVVVVKGNGTQQAFLATPPRPTGVQARFASTTPVPTRVLTASGLFGDPTPLRIVNLASGIIESAMSVTLEGFPDGSTLQAFNGMARNPVTGVIYAVVQTNQDGESSRFLCTLDAETGEASFIAGGLEFFTRLATTNSGDLVGLMGNGGPTPNTLFSIDATTGAVSELGQLATSDGGSGGDAIAVNRTNGLLYHNHDDTFESVNLDGVVASEIGLFGEGLPADPQSMTHYAGDTMLVAFEKIDCQLVLISAGGVVTPGPIIAQDYIKGMVCLP